MGLGPDSGVMAGSPENDLLGSTANVWSRARGFQRSRPAPVTRGVIAIGLRIRVVVSVSVCPVWKFKERACQRRKAIGWLKAFRCT